MQYRWLDGLDIVLGSVSSVDRNGLQQLLAANSFKTWKRSGYSDRMKQILAVPIWLLFDMETIQSLENLAAGITAVVLYTQSTLLRRFPVCLPCAYRVKLHLPSKDVLEGGGEEWQA
jgi:hypothetical protein